MLTTLSSKNKQDELGSEHPITISISITSVTDTKNSNEQATFLSKKFSGFYTKISIPIYDCSMMRESVLETKNFNGTDSINE